MTKRDFKILVSTNDDIMRDVIRSLLSKEGYSVLSVKNGLDAIKTLRVEEISLVISDLRIPVADGIEVMKQGVKINPYISVVLLTTFSELDVTLKAVKEGDFDYLTKPFKIEEVSFLVDKAYRRAVLINENRELLRYIRDTYHDMEVVKTAAQSKNPEITLNWIERIERLKALSVLTDQEVEILKERLVKGI
ncbi:MAG: response regulator [Thermodesulfovibrionales bacterium]